MPELSPVDVGFSLATTRSVFEQRAVVLGDLAGGLEALGEGREAAGVVRGSAGGSDGRAVFVFPGQGSQWLGMAAELLDSSSVFAERVGECAAALAPFVDWSLTDILRDTDSEAWLEQVDVVQPVRQVGQREVVALDLQHVVALGRDGVAHGGVDLGLLGVVEQLGPGRLVDDVDGGPGAVGLEDPRRVRHGSTVLPKISPMICRSRRRRFV